MISELNKSVVTITSATLKTSTYSLFDSVNVSIKAQK